MSDTGNLLSLINALYRWRKPLIITSLIAAFAAAGISLLLPNYYKANTVFYPGSPDLGKPMPLGESDKDIRIYGSDTDLDRLLSIANSEELYTSIIDEYNLMERYEIDSSDPKAEYKVRLAFSKLYEITKNKFDAVELTVEDKEPMIAAKIANSARDKISELSQKIVKESQFTIITNYETSISSKEKTKTIIADSLSDLKKKYKIFSAGGQAESLASELTSTKAQLAKNKSKLRIYQGDPVYRDSVIKVKAVVAGLEEQYQSLKGSADLFSEGIADIEIIQRELKNIGDQVSLDKERIKQIKAAYNSPFVALHVVQQAEEPKVKSRPKRSLIVMATTAFVFFLLSAWVMFITQYSNVDWRSVFSDDKV